MDAVAVTFYLACLEHEERKQVIKTRRYTLWFILAVGSLVILALGVSLAAIILHLTS